MWPFRAGMFLNFLLQIVHSTGFSPREMDDEAFLDSFDEIPFLLTTIGDCLGVLAIEDELLE